MPFRPWLHSWPTVHLDKLDSAAQYHGYKPLAFVPSCALRQVREGLVTLLTWPGLLVRVYQSTELLAALCKNNAEMLDGFEDRRWLAYARF